MSLELVLLCHGDIKLQDPLVLQCLCACHSYWFLKLTSGQMAAQSTKIMVHLALNITYLLSYFFACVTAGANSRVFHGVKDMAGK